VLSRLVVKSLSRNAYRYSSSLSIFQVPYPYLSKQILRDTTQLFSLSAIQQFLLPLLPFAQANPCRVNPVPYDTGYGTKYFLCALRVLPLFCDLHFNHLWIPFAQANPCRVKGQIFSACSACSVLVLRSTFQSSVDSIRVSESLPCQRPNIFCVLCVFCLSSAIYIHKLI
jgi:hypothetical protein